MKAVSLFDTTHRLREATDKGNSLFVLLVFMTSQIYKLAYLLYLLIDPYNLFMCICPSPITNYASVYKFMPPFSFSIEIC